MSEYFIGIRVDNSGLTGHAMVTLVDASGQTRVWGGTLLI